MKSDYFYSKSTGLYVYRKPVVIDARVKNAAKNAKVSLQWDDEGRLNYLDFDDSIHLLEALGSVLMNPNQYWLILNDAKQENDEDMIEELTSSQYTEWLNRVYIANDKFIDSPKIISKYKYSGTIQTSKAPDYKPGYFNPENNITDTGEPILVIKQREKFSTSWKYWAPGVEGLPCGAGAPIRGYVTSVGKPSYDLGIPTDNRQPKLMIRECRLTPLTKAVDEKILEEAESIKDIIEFTKKYGELFSTSKDSLIYKIREQIIDKLGDEALDTNIKDAADKICPLHNKKISYSHFREFILNSISNLKKALAENKDIIFVMGHKNPDSDTVISSMFEAYRNSLIDSTAVYIPVVQSKRMPDEIAHLIGELSDHILMSDNEIYNKAKNSGLARWISVDQNREPEVQKYFISIIDHHFVTNSAKNRDFTKTLEMVGSTATLITRKFLGMGFELDEKTAHLLYGAALMDTENKVKHKMTQVDYKIMNYLKLRSKVDDDNQFYGTLMSHLLSTNDAELLFGRDYKEDWGFGFAVAKIKNGFSERGEILKEDLDQELVRLAVDNNKQKNLPLTLLKITDYKENNETVNLERIYMVFNNVSLEFENAIKHTIECIIKFEFPGETVKVQSNKIDFYGEGLQLSRKKTAPVLEPVVAAFNRYFYSKSINKWVKRDFQKQTKIINENYSTDKEGRINYITKEEADTLAKNSEFSMLSLPEFWKVRRDAINNKDQQMISSLEGSNFVEFLDSEIKDKKILINHGKEKIEINIPEGNPGLIHPDDIAFETGLPTKVHPPNIYGNRELWRYWEPDADIVYPCRSYIFILEQPCLDGKFHPGESFPNLGIRPVRDKIINPELQITWDEHHLNVKIEEHEETKTWKWPKLIWET
ncbi:MAG: DHH family phosphoesterase [Candidatus Nanoarchaeia archaeon]